LLQAALAAAAVIKSALAETTLREKREIMVALLESTHLGSAAKQLRTK
jgi:hypothetical protein